MDMLLHNTTQIKLLTDVEKERFVKIEWMSRSPNMAAMLLGFIWLKSTTDSELCFLFLKILFVLRLYLYLTRAANGGRRRW